MSERNYFDPISPRVDFIKLEEEILDYWRRQSIEKKYLQRNRRSPRYFSFLDGPITANNPMGVHHAWGRTYKDLWQRYKNMRGFRQRFQNGFDCQGLWVEVEVEKELGFKNKKEIEKYGVEKFVEKCRERVLHFAEIQTEQSKRLGYFMDWDHSYFTMSDENNYMIWHFLKVCHQNDWIYKGRDSVPWCPRCETAISQHEILTEDYREIRHDSIIMKLPLVNRKKEFLLVWTTTPWTIPANIAVAIDSKADYSLVADSDHSEDKFWLASALVEKVMAERKGKIIKTVKGEELVGLHYRTAFDNLPAVEKARREKPKLFHSVVATDDLLMPISLDEGTGLVHTAVSAGEEDFKLGKKLGLPLIPVIADNADYLTGFGDFSGQNAKKNPEIILDYLRSREKKEGQWVFKIFPYNHRYPVCWRCKTELVWKVADEWYIAMDRPTKLTGGRKGPTLRERMLKTARKIKWIPRFGLKRELDWLNNMEDWLISKKNRYWGLALPIWECSCGYFEVIGSKEELKEKAVSGWEEFSGKSPHKPQIDFVKIKCPECGSLMQRIEPVGNPWLDAGIVTFSTISDDNQGEPLYLKDKKEWRKWVPANFITESFPGQFKNWFYSLIAMSTVLEDLNPTETVLGFATLLAEDGRPMHKSWGNAIEFNEGAEKIGADVMRWIFVRQNVAENLLFGYKLADEVRSRFHLKLWNVYNFLVTYANIDGWRPTGSVLKENLSLGVLDRWLLISFADLVKGVTAELENYRAATAGGLIEDFVIDNLSNWYLRRSRTRVGPLGDNLQDKEAFYQTLYFVMVNLAKLLAPFLPFLTESIYRNLTKEKSVHLADWPDFELPFSVEDNNLIGKMDFIKETVEKIHAVRKELGIPVRQPLLRAQVKTANPFSRNLDKEILQLALDELNLKKIEFIHSDEESVSLDTKITRELEEEAKLRELLRKVQEERKKMGLSFSQKTVIVSSWLPENKELLEQLLKKTFSVRVEKGKDFKVELVSER